MNIGLALTSDGVGLEEVVVPEGYTPAWRDGGVYANVGNANPITACLKSYLQVCWPGDAYHPDYIDLREFVLPVDVIAKNFRIFSFEPANNLWRHVIYRKSDRMKIWDSGITSTVFRGWNAYSMNDLPMFANVPYWYTCIPSNGTAGIASFLVPKSFAISSKQYGNYGKAPIGNLNIGAPVNVTAWLSGADIGTAPSVLPAETADSTLNGINLELPIGFIATF